MQTLIYQENEMRNQHYERNQHLLFQADFINIKCKVKNFFIAHKKTERETDSDLEV